MSAIKIQRRGTLGGFGTHARYRLVGSGVRETERGLFNEGCVACMIDEWIWNMNEMIQTGEDISNLLSESLSQCHFAHHTDWPR
jgi:hypothetical protein